MRPHTPPDEYDYTICGSNVVLCQITWPPCIADADIIFLSCDFFFFFMVALCNKADHYIFALWFLSYSFFLLSFFFLA